MKPVAVCLALLVTPVVAAADPIPDIVDRHILPKFHLLAQRTKALSGAAHQECDPRSAALRAAYGAAFDAWVSASHLRFGPTEVNDRAFALAFWSDKRGATPRALTALLTQEDSIATSAQTYAEASVAARGVYALEYLLYDEALISMAGATYRCALLQAVSADMAASASAIYEDWQSDFAAKLRSPEPAAVYRSPAEVLQVLFKSLSTGLQFTSETRLGRPLGRFDRPRPARAEARRSGRSSRHVQMSLAAQQDLALRLAGDEAELRAKLQAGFMRALLQLADLQDPVFEGVADPQSRLKIESLQQSVDAIRAIVREDLGPKLGVTVGFNALDGD
ncbi:imelysin family protein [uncultured Litoreibacter sp.]|uniref:imelysin family protein n=1 Tax=uncultured Litoreibacter sp. TaxID=1392394 RepID=UPI002632B52F|nr:imelysin family protein [uncultured Litoreibacter sp.]